MVTVKNTVGITANDISVLHTANEYKQLLLKEISQATSRIYLSALYIQDDEAGREILQAIYQAKQNTPSLDVCLFVDFHRAQRGLIGDKASGGNRDFYLELAQQYESSIRIYGVPVKRKELLGVLHLKGLVIDDMLIYSGASINDIYLQQHGRYRLDRYYRMFSPQLSDDFCEYLTRCFIDSGLVPLLNQLSLPDRKQLKRDIPRLTKRIKKTRYRESQCHRDASIQASMHVGCGRRGNKLNRLIRDSVRDSQSNLVIFTPYFNLPKPLLRDLDGALKRGVKVTLTIGDKKASDFYNGDEATFSTVEIVPYIYERLLVSFLTRRQKYLSSGQLEVRLWQHENNSFHLKGMVIDQRYHLLTGSNLNPRAWALDLENGILLDDKEGSLQGVFAQELEHIFQHTTVIKDASQIDNIESYPDKPRKLLKKLRMIQIDRLLKRFL